MCVTVRAILMLDNSAVFERLSRSISALLLAF